MLRYKITLAECSIELYAHHKKSVLEDFQDLSTTKAKLISSYETEGNEAKLKYSANIKKGTSSKKKKVYFRAQSKCGDGTLSLSNIKGAKTYGYGNSGSVKSVPKKLKKKFS